MGQRTAIQPTVNQAPMEPITYGIKNVDEYQMVWLDKLRIPHPTGKLKTGDGMKIYRAAMWRGKGGARVIGPEHMAFPHPKGWRMHG